MNAVASPPGFEGDIQDVTEPDRETGNPEVVLRLLSSIERDSAITQRKLAGHLGIALGLANAYLRRCIRKGFVKATRVPFNRYAYYVTPQGFAEKSRLTASYFAASLDFFRRARGECGMLLAQCADDGWSRVALFGAGDLAEIADSERRRGRDRGGLRHRRGQAGTTSCRTADRRKPGRGAACRRCRRA